MARPSSSHAATLLALMTIAGVLLIAIEARVLVERDSKSAALSAEMAEDVADLKAQVAANQEPGDSKKSSNSSSIKIKQMPAKKQTTSEPEIGDDSSMSDLESVDAGDNVMVVSEKKFQQLVQKSSNSSNSTSSSTVIKSVSSSAGSSKSRKGSHTRHQTSAKPVAIKTADGGLIVSRNSLKNMHKSTSTGKPKTTTTTTTTKPTTKKQAAAAVAAAAADSKQVDATIQLLGPSDSLSTWEDLEETRNLNGEQVFKEERKSSSSSSGTSNSTSTSDMVQEIIRRKPSTSTATGEPKIVKKHTTTGKPSAADRKHISSTARPKVTSKPRVNVSTGKPSVRKQSSTTDKPSGGKDLNSEKSPVKKHSSTGRPSNDRHSSTGKPADRKHSTTGKPSGKKQSSTGKPVGVKHSTTGKPKHFSSSTAKPVKRVVDNHPKTSTTHRPTGKASRTSRAPVSTSTTSKRPSGKTTVATTTTTTTTHTPRVNNNEEYKELKESDRMLAVVLTNKGGFKGRRLNGLAVARILGNKLEGVAGESRPEQDKPIVVSPNNTYVFPAGHYYFPRPVRFAGFVSP